MSRRYVKKSPQIITETEITIVDKTTTHNKENQNHTPNTRKRKKRNKKQNHIQCYNNMRRSKLVRERCVSDDALSYAESILNRMVDFSERSKAYRSMMKLFSNECPEAMIYITSSEKCSAFIMYSTGDRIAKHFDIDDLVDIYYDFKQKRYKIVIKDQ